MGRGDRGLAHITVGASQWVAQAHHLSPLTCATNSKPVITRKALQVQPMPTSCTLPRGPPAAAVFALPRIYIAGHGAMYGTRPLQLRHIPRNGFDDTPLKVTNVSHGATNFACLQIANTFPTAYVVCHEGTCTKAPPFRTQKPISIPWRFGSVELCKFPRFIIFRSYYLKNPPFCAF